MVQDVTLATQQVTEGLTAGLGFDLKEKIANALSTKKDDETKNTENHSSEADTDYKEV